MDVAVLGAGQRGRDLAQVAAVAGHTVHLHDGDVDAVMDGVDVIEAQVDDAAVLDRLDATTGLEAAVTGADIVVETATEQVAGLQETFAAVEEHAERETLVATSAPTVSVTAAAAGLRHPDRALGLRFRNLVDVALVEVVVADQTTEEACRRATSFVADLDRSHVLVRDTPGAAATRLALALEAEAMRLVDEGVASVAAVDDALVLGHDHPTGPLEAADRAGLADRLDTFEYLAGALGERFEPPTVLRELVAEGRTGKGAGEGFYRWEDDEPTEPAVSPPDLPRAGDAPDDPSR